MADGEDGIAQKKLRRVGGVCVVLRAQAKPGGESALEVLLHAFAERVRADEIGCAAYVISRALGSPAQFAVHARFVSWEAFNAHAETTHLEEALPALTAQLATPVTLEIFLEV